ERITPEALAPDDRLEEERVALVGELQIKRQRRIEIRERLEDQRYAVVPLRGQCAKFGFGHDVPASCDLRQRLQRDASLEGARDASALSALAPPAPVVATGPRPRGRVVGVGTAGAHRWGPYTSRIRWGSSVSV